MIKRNQDMLPDKILVKIGNLCEKPVEIYNTDLS
jgi:hypothetical protein